MRKRDINKLKRLYTYSEEKLHNVLLEILEKYNYIIFEKMDYYIFAVHEIQTPLLLLSHIDTVHDIKPTFKNMIVENQSLYNKLGGCGADDRNGIFAIIKMLQKGYRPDILFTHGEECGGIGVSEFVIDFKDSLLDYKFTIEIDRKGIGEAVFYNCGNKDFKDMILNYGFTEEIGTYTDIGTLCPQWDIAGVNLSAGYIDEHTFYEKTLISGLEYTMKRLEKIIKDIKELEYYNFQDKYKYKKWDSDYKSYGTKFNIIPIEKDYPVCKKCGSYSIYDSFCYSCGYDEYTDTYHDIDKGGWNDA